MLDTLVNPVKPQKDAGREEEEENQLVSSFSFVSWVDAPI